MSIGVGDQADWKRTFIRNACQHDPNYVRNCQAQSIEDFALREFVGGGATDASNVAEDAALEAHRTSGIEQDFS
jgi:hypothetical protein